MTDILNERYEMLCTAREVRFAVSEFITRNTITEEEWPNGITIAMTYSKGLGLLGCIKSLNAKYIVLGDDGSEDSWVMDSMLSLYEPLKDYLCGMEVLLNKFPTVFRRAAEEGNEHEGE